MKEKEKAREQTFIADASLSIECLSYDGDGTKKSDKDDGSWHRKWMVMTAMQVKIRMEMETTNVTGIKLY